MPGRASGNSGKSEMGYLLRFNRPSLRTNRRLEWVPVDP